VYFGDQLIKTGQALRFYQEYPDELRRIVFYAENAGTGPLSI